MDLYRKTYAEIKRKNLKLKYYTKKALSMSPQELVNKILQRTNRQIKEKIQKTKDLHGNTCISFDVDIIKNSYIDIKELDISSIDIQVAGYLSQMYCEHRFDLLGSGWVKNTYDSKALGVEGYKYDMNVDESLSRFQAQNYTPIDWQKDYKSGFRWDEAKWYKDQRIGHKLGSDIKVPWELARLQHLPQLAIFSLADECLMKQNIKEFKFQVLDFIRNNPPRMGVNWVCTMDVGIRAANMLIAYDMFSQMDSDEILDKTFKQEFANSIYEHGIHIINNLEYNKELTSNHYLSDIVGLLYISSYLTCSYEVNRWLAFSIQEILNEMQNEFYEDGGNFESSTSYHRLSGELMVYGTALILALKEDKIKSLKEYDSKTWKVELKLKSGITTVLPQWYIDRLYKIGRFTKDITKPNGQIPQFGDNDSGRFFRFSPNGKFIANIQATEKYINLKDYFKNNELFWDENILNHNAFISCFFGLFEDETFKNNMKFERSFIASMVKRKLQPNDISYEEVVKNNKNLSRLTYQKTISYNINIDLNDLKFIPYPDSGIFIFKVNDMQLSICATPLGQKDNGGHTHNDKLSYDLYINGVSITQDAGTYLYTPLPHRRNEFRSVKAHNVPIVEDMEQNGWYDGQPGLFSLFPHSSCFVVDFGYNFLEILLKYNDIEMIRRFEIRSSKVEIIDKCNKEFGYSDFKFYSCGYGKLELV